MADDLSNGYDAVAEDYIAARSDAGRSIVEQWAASFPANSAVLDIGAGTGKPVTTTLLEAGHKVWAVDASPKLVDVFHQNFPQVAIRCEAVEDSDFFGRKFDAVIAIGLVFLLAPQAQADLIHRVADSLAPGGHFLFSAPHQKGEWDDILTGQRSVSLGLEAYAQLLTEAGLSLINRYEDEGQSHHYSAQKLVA